MKLRENVSFNGNYEITISYKVREGDMKKVYLKF